MATHRDELIARQREKVMALMPEAMDRVDWPRERLAAYREAALRRLIAHAQKNSPWHAERLAGIDADTFTEADLACVPAMTKADLMANFDAIATDCRITLARCEAHMASGARLLDGAFSVAASGGTSGVRAVTVGGLDEFGLNWPCFTRMIRRWRARTGALKGEPRMVSVTAPSGPNASSRLLSVFGGGGVHLAVTDPIDEIAQKLNAADPEIVLLYPSILPRLCEEALAGRLRIRPRLVVTVAEPCLPEHRACVETVWKSTIIAGYGATEVGLLGGGSGFDDGLLLFDDIAIIEPVDHDERSVSPGERADKLFVTPLFKRAMPLIRYELTDQLTVSDRAPSCGSGFRLASMIEGRLDDSFTYDGDIIVHPGVFRTVLGANTAILEYQVRQTPSGAQIRAVCNGPLDSTTLIDALTARLARLGLAAPEIEISGVAAIERTAGSAKLKRFVPLRPADAGSERPGIRKPL